MKDAYEILRQKEVAIEVVRKEIAALRFVAPLLTDDGDPKRDARNDFGLPERTDDGRPQVQPVRVRDLHEVQDRAIDASKNAERHQHGKGRERHERDCAPSHGVDVITGRVRRTMTYPTTPRNVATATQRIARGSVAASWL